MQRVLFRIGDHYTRVKVAAQLNLAEKSQSPKNTVYSAVGCLLGEQHGRTVDVESSFEMQLDGEQGIDMELLSNRIDLCTSLYSFSTCRRVNGSQVEHGCIVTVVQIKKFIRVPMCWDGIGQGVRYLRKI